MRENKFPLKENTVFQIPYKVLVETEGYLKVAGAVGKECTVFWGGIGQGDIAEVRSVYYPSQISTAVSVDVNPDGVHEMYGLLDQRKEILLAQVHTHPGTAFHSSIDDSFPATFLVGFLSIVVPHFCRPGFGDFSNCTVFIHTGLGQWRRLTPSEVRGRLLVLES